MARQPGEGLQRVHHRWLKRQAERRNKERSHKERRNKNAERSNKERANKERANKHRARVERAVDETGGTYKLSLWKSHAKFGKNMPYQEGFDTASAVHVNVPRRDIYAKSKH